MSKKIKKDVNDIDSMEYAKKMIEFIDKNPKCVFYDDFGNRIPTNIVKMSYQKYIHDQQK